MLSYVRQCSCCMLLLVHQCHFCMLSYVRGAGTAYLSGAPELTPGFQWDSYYSILSCICMFCRSLFVLLYFFVWPLCCLFFIDIRILITPFASSNSSSLMPMQYGIICSSSSRLHATMGSTVLVLCHTIYYSIVYRCLQITEKKTIMLSIRILLELSDICNLYLFCFCFFFPIMFVLLEEYQ